MPKTRITVTVDRALLEKYRQAAGNDANLSAIVAMSLEDEIHRYEWLALLDEWDRENPISIEERAAGERLVQEIESSSTGKRSHHDRSEGPEPPG
jgi:post-segregation antitoxin (ccd killing protein)